jgi:hypothetical protein
MLQAATVFSCLQALLLRTLVLDACTVTVLPPAIASATFHHK